MKLKNLRTNQIESYDELLGKEMVRLGRASYIEEIPQATNKMISTNTSRKFKKRKSKF